MIRILSRYFYTIKNLKLIQIYYLFFYNLYKPKIIFNKNLNIKVDKIKVNFLKNDFTPFIDINKKNYTFNNITFKTDKNFNTHTKDKLWIYHLHYFDFLNSNKVNFKIKVGKINNWIRYQSISFDERFDSYPLSIRIVNFIKFAIENNYHKKYFLNSIFNQFEYLQNRIEYNIQGNHLLTNIKALIFSGVFFHNNLTNEWTNKLLVILEIELKKQFTSNSFHKEGSLLYQRIILEDLFDIYLLIKNSNLSYHYEFLIPYIEGISKSCQYLYFSKYNINNFNDSFKRNDLTPDNILFKNIKREFPKFDTNEDFLINKDWKIFSKFDYKIIINSFDDFLEYQPGHIHASLLAFELEIKNVKIFSNKGVSTYEDNLKRKLERSTRSYNTLQINTDNIHDTWKSFRLGRRAKIQKNRTIFKDNKYKISLSHDGYYKKYKTYHKRNFILEENIITIIDSLNNNFQTRKHNVNVRYYVEKSAKLEVINNKKIKMLIKNVIVYLTFSSDVYIRNTYISRGINSRIKSKVIIIPYTGNNLNTKIVWKQK